VFAILMSIKAPDISWAFDVSEIVKLELSINAIEPNALTLNLFEHNLVKIFQKT